MKTSWGQRCVEWPGRTTDTVRHLRTLHRPRCRLASLDDARTVLARHLASLGGSLQTPHILEHTSELASLARLGGLALLLLEHAEADGVA